jgi:hypothetical protein
MPLSRDAIKAAFRLAINKSKTRTEARRINRLRGKYLSGTLTPIEALIGWLDLTLDAKVDPKYPGLKMVQP